MATAVNRNIPAYTAGTASAAPATQYEVTSGGTTVRRFLPQAVQGNGTSWMVVDSYGNLVAQVFPGDMFVPSIIDAAGQYAIKSVDAPDQITLEVPLPIGFINSPYRILRYTPSPSGAVIGATQQLLAQGSDDAPDLARTFDSGAGRIKIRGLTNGAMEIAAGGAGAVDSALAPALRFYQDGTVTNPSTITPSQYLRALVSIVPGGASALDAALAASPDDPSRIILAHSVNVPPGGAFESVVVAALTLTPQQVASIRQLALTLSV